MPLSGLPLVTKYAYLDYVFILLAGRIESVQIASWRVVVDNPLDDSEGRQRTYYKFLDKGNLELIESKIYSSRNHLLVSLKGDYNYLNIACESRTGGSSIFQSLGVQRQDNIQITFADWVDLAGFDFKGVNFQPYATPQIASGLVSIVSGSDQLTGNGTSFTDEFNAGYPILINDYEGNPNGIVRLIESIEDDENMTLTSVVNTDYTDVRAYSFLNEVTQKGEGTVTFTGGTNAVTGSGTNFTDLHVHDLIQVVDNNGIVRTRIIATITDDEHLTTATNLPVSGTGTSWYNYLRMKTDVGFLEDYHGDGSSPEEIQGAKAVVFDGTNLFTAVMPSYMDTKEKFREYVRSYDAVTTVWVDGSLMGRP